MADEDNTSPDNESIRRHYDVDFLLKIGLGEMELYSEYVLEIDGKIMVTAVPPDFIEKDSEQAGQISARLIQMGLYHKLSCHPDVDPVFMRVNL